jgi:hypothetical protein
MTRRWRIFVVLLMAGVLGLWFWLASGPREPVYEGRTLSSWLDHHVPSSAARPPYNSPGWHKAAEAIRAIGTNGIPTLVAMIRAKDPSPTMQKLLRIAGRYRWIGINYRSALERNEEAEYGFHLLNSNAVSAVSELIRIYKANVSPSSQRCAALALGSIGRRAQAALPVFIRDFTHTNDQVRFYAVSAVMHIGGEPDVVIPPLTRALQDSDVNVRWNALVGLERFGSRARSVVPEIAKMLHDPGMVGTSSITQAVETALWRIAPEKVGQPFVVEDATPMITNNVTTEAVKFLFYGKRQVLVPAASAVPAIRQYWSSDPRPRLTMYRGSSAADGKDHLLGQFEVLGVPAETNVNISTLCVIAAGKIFLCARDNGKDRFLEIRRVEGAP